MNFVNQVALLLSVISLPAHAVFYSSTDPADQLNVTGWDDYSSIGHVFTADPASASGSGWGCTGSVLTSRLILTAAHCVYGYSSTSTVDFFSSSYGFSRFSGISATNPSYNPSTHAYDSALIYLNSDLPTYLKRFTLYSGSSFAGLDFAFAGFGKYGTSGNLISPAGDTLHLGTNTFTNYDANSTSMQAQFTSSTVRNSDSSKLTPSFDNSNSSPRTEVLEGASGQGDSGGPAFRWLGGQLVEAGISSFWYDVNHNLLADIGENFAYSLVSDSKNWLDSVARSDGQSIQWTPYILAKNTCPAGFFCKPGGDEYTDGSAPLSGALGDPLYINDGLPLEFIDPVGNNVPEPSSFALVLLGLLIVLIVEGKKHTLISLFHKSIAIY